MNIFVAYKMQETMKKDVTVKIILDTRRSKHSGLFPAKLRVTFQRKQKYYPINIKNEKGENLPFDLSPDDFDRVFGVKPRGEFKAHRDHLDELKSKAFRVIDSLPFFTFDQFEAKFFGEQVGNVSSTDLTEAYNSKMKELFEDGRISSYRGYEMSRNSLLGFRANLKFYDVTPDFLRRYKKQMEQDGKSTATIGIYLRYLRALFNEAIDAGVIPESAYPFGKRKNGFQIPTKRNPAEPLKQHEIEKIFRYLPANEAEAKARDLWVFSFLLNGANMKDISNLKFRDIDFHAERIIFYRSKTRRTAANQKAIEVSLTPVLLAIIKRWGNPLGSPDDFVFPIFQKGMTPKQQYTANGNARKTITKYMGRIAEKLGIAKTNVHNYTARDTFANAQRMAGESGDAIGEAFGHENRATTDTYLDKFGEDTQRRMAGNALRYLGVDENIPA